MADEKFIVEVGVTGDGEVRFQRVTKAAREAGAALEDTAKRAEKSSGMFQGLGGELDKFKGRFADIFTVSAGVVAAEAVIGTFGLIKNAAFGFFDTLVTDGVRAAQESETAVAGLNQALQSTGIYSKTTSDALQDLAAELQNTTKYEDDAVIAASALIQNLGQLSEQGLKDATRAAVNLSAALGKDLDSAAQAVGKAAAGSTDGLAKFGIHIEKTGNAAKDAELAIAALNARFGGSATAQLDTFEGATSLLKNQFGNLKEEIGNTIIKNESLVAVIRSASEGMSRLADFVKANQTGLSSFVTNGVVLAVDAIGIMVAAGELAALTFLKMEAAAAKIPVTINAIGSAVSFGLVGTGEVAQRATERLNGLNASIEHMKNGETVFTSINAKLTEMRNAALDAGKAKVDGAERATTAYGTTGGKVRELSDELKKLGAEGARLAEQAENKDPNVQYEKEIIALHAAYEQKKITQDQLFLAQAVYEDARLAKIQQTEAKGLEAAGERAHREIELLDNLASKDAALNADRIATQQQTLTDMVQNENLTAKDREKIQGALVRAQNKLEEDRVSKAKLGLNFLAQLQDSKIKEMHGIGKAAAAASATIATYQGATAAYAAMAGIPVVGPALGIAAAAAAIAAGLGNVASIYAVNLATGIDEVPAGYPNDTFAANLTSGERVVPVQTNKDLKAFLADSAGMSEILAAIYHRLGNLERRTHVYIGNREIMNVIQEEIYSGRRLVNE